MRVDGVYSGHDDCRPVFAPTSPRAAVRHTASGGGRDGDQHQLPLGPDPWTSRVLRSYSQKAGPSTRHRGPRVTSVRRRGRVDDNHAAIVGLLRGCGCSVFSTAGVGDGFPDLVVGFHDVTHLIEIKDGLKPPSKRRLTDDERAWHETWQGEPVYIVESLRGAEALVRRWAKNAANTGR
jgi:hypothetical protein